MKINPKFLLFAFIFSLVFTKYQSQADHKRWTYKVGGRCNFEKTQCGLIYPNFNNSVSAGISFIAKHNKSIWSFQTGISNSYFAHPYYKSMHYNYLQLPLNMRIDKFGFYFLGGIGLQYLYKISNTDANYDRWKKFSPAINHALGYEQKIKNRLGFFIELRYYYEVSIHMYALRFSSYGISAGLNWRLNN